MTHHPKDPTVAEPYLLQKTLGYRMTKWEVDLAEVQLDLEEKHMNRNMTPHGGIYALLLDTACAFCGSCPPEGQPYRVPQTLSLNTSFLGVPKGQRLICTARKIGGGYRNWFAEGEVLDETGTLLCRGSATLRYLSPKGAS